MRKAMTFTRTHSSSPPLHVHVNDTTPVHVHRKKSPKISPIKTPQGKSRYDAGNLHATAKVKTRVPWIPPGKGCKGWEGPTHRLEITPFPDLEPGSALTLAELSFEEEEVLHGRIGHYERTIDSLMTKVSSLKSEVDLRKNEQHLSASQRVIAEQEQKLAEAVKELVVTEQENVRLRHSMEKMREFSDYSRLEWDNSMSQDKDALLRKLMEAEMDGKAAAKQMSALRNSVSKARSAGGSVDLRKKEQQLSASQRVIAEHLSASQKVIAEQEQELAEAAKELVVTEQENTRLRHSMEKMREDSDYSRLEWDSMSQDKDALLRKLMEAEMDGKVVAKQMLALRDCVSKTRSADGSRLSGFESSISARHKELLLQKLETFEATNRTLRHLLREQHSREMESIDLAEQKDSLLKRLTDTEAENAHLVVKLQEREREVDQFSTFLDTEKGNAKSAGELSKALESTRAHLQGQLRSKEADNNRLVVQIKNLERAANQQRGEMEQLAEQLGGLRQQAGTDREALKRATRAQKLRAERSEDVAGQLTAQLLDMEKQVTDVLSAAESWRIRHAEEVKDKSQLEIEVSVLNSRVEDLSEQLQRTEVKGRAEREDLLEQLHGLTTEGKTAKLDNHSLKASLSAVEDQLSLSQHELQHVNTSVQQYESLVDSFKIQVGKTRAEADEYCARLDQAEREARVVRKELEQEVEHVQRELVGRLTELEPLPEALRCCKLQLHKAMEQEHVQERRSMELSQALADLRMKVETQGSHVELLRQKNKVLLESNKQLQQWVESLERKLEEAGCQNSDLLAIIAKREETIDGNQLRLDDKTRECSLLSCQLEEALDDARQQVSDTRDRAVSRDRSTQSKLMDLETQLSKTTSDIKTLQRSKEEMERRYQSRLQDVKDRLEQSDSTNRSLQNYVQFLKASYSSVFGDTTVALYVSPHPSDNIPPPTPI